MREIGINTLIKDKEKDGRVENTMTAKLGKWNKHRRLERLDEKRRKTYYQDKEAFQRDKRIYDTMIRTKRAIN